MVVGLGVVFAVVDGVAHFIFVAGDDEGGVDSARDALDVRGPAVRKQNIHIVLVADMRDPVEIAPRPLRAGLIAGLDDGESIGRP